MKSNEKICIGEISKAHGIKGQVMILPFVDDPKLLLMPEGVTNDSGTRVFKILKAAPHKHALLSTIEGVNDRDDVEALRGTKLYILRDQMPETDEDEVYHLDMIGLDVIHDGKVIGTVKDVVNYGASDIIEVARAGQDNVLIPFTKTTVSNIDLDAGSLEIHPPEGLMELYE